MKIELTEETVKELIEFLQHTNVSTMSEYFTNRRLLAELTWALGITKFVKAAQKENTNNSELADYMDARIHEVALKGLENENISNK